MSMIISRTMMATDTARHLPESTGLLHTPVRCLSSGLRVGQTLDDAAGPGIRELTRTDVTSLSQGLRNANDAISLIQVVDGALGVIDEKLILMKELAEQAATGTYSSGQRLMIESEYQKMALEISRIARDTRADGKLTRAEPAP